MFVQYGGGVSNARAMWAGPRLLGENEVYTGQLYKLKAGHTSGTAVNCLSTVSFEAFGSQEHRVPHSHLTLSFITSLFYTYTLFLLKFLPIFGLFYYSLPLQHCFPLHLPSLLRTFHSKASSAYLSTQRMMVGGRFDMFSFDHDL